MLFDEAEIIVQRDNARMATEAVLLKAAVEAVLTEEAGKHFGELVNGLSGDE